MTDPCDVVVFDVNETLSDMSPLAARFEEVGAPGMLAGTWFATLLRDGFALTVNGRAQPFATLGAGALRGLLATAGVTGDVEAKIQHVLTGMAGLQLHPDVAEGVRMLHDAGLRLVTLTNGAVETTEQLLRHGGIRDQFERLLSVQDAGQWKPASAAYRYASAVCGAPLGRMLLVAVHPWDIDGAIHAGMQAGWLNRAGLPYPDYFHAPTYTAPGVAELANELTRSP